MSNSVLTYTIENHDSENLNELLELIKSNYSDGDITEVEYLKWQYKNNPFGLPLMQVARESVSNRIVGQYLVIPIEYVSNNNIVKGTLSLNTLTHEDYRGKGLFTKLAFETYVDCLKKNIQFTIGFPNPNSYPGFVKKLGFSNPGELQFLIKPVNYVRLFLALLKSIGQKKRHGNELTISTFKDVTLFNDCEISEFDPTNDKDSYCVFWNKNSKEYSFTTNRTYEYILWRYINIPTRTYRVLKIKNNEEIVAIIVLRTKELYGINTGILIDFICDRNLNNKIYKSAFKIISSYLNQNNINLFVTLMNSSIKEYAFFRSLKFTRISEKILPQSFPFIVRNHKSLGEDVFQFSESYLMFGDYDVL